MFHLPSRTRFRTSIPSRTPLTRWLPSKVPTQTHTQSWWSVGLVHVSLFRVGRGISVRVLVTDLPWRSGRLSTGNLVTVFCTSSESSEFRPWVGSSFDPRRQRPWGTEEKYRWWRRRRRLGSPSSHSTSTGTQYLRTSGVESRGRKIETLEPV